jgi:DNA polymerase-3 subunit gamma/tau
MEIALEDGGPPGLAGELSRKLEAWTGQRWIVMLAKEGGEAPIAHQERDSRARALRELREHPDVAAVLRRFPGAEILDIRDTAPERPMEDPDEESR